MQIFLAQYKTTQKDCIERILFNHERNYVFPINKGICYTFEIYSNFMPYLKEVCISEIFRTTIFLKSFLVLLCAFYYFFKIILNNYKKHIVK